MGSLNDVGAKRRAGQRVAGSLFGNPPATLGRYSDGDDNSWPPGWWILPGAVLGALAWVGIIYSVVSWAQG